MLSKYRFLGLIILLIVFIKRKSIFKFIAEIYLSSKKLKLLDNINDEHRLFPKRVVLSTRDVHC